LLQYNYLLNCNILFTY